MIKERYVPGPFFAAACRHDPATGLEHWTIDYTRGAGMGRAWARQDFDHFERLPLPLVARALCAYLDSESIEAASEAGRPLNPNDLDHNADIVNEMAARAAAGWCQAEGLDEVELGRLLADTRLPVPRARPVGE